MASKPRPPKMQQLHKSLYQLQANGSAVLRDVRRAHRVFYAHVAAVYFWWREASAVTGYLEAEYGKLNRKFKTRVKYGINFSPLLVLVWGNDNCKTADLDRHSRALNRIHSEFESRAKYYAKDGVAKLALYIEHNHGIHGLTGYGNSAADAEDEQEIDEGGHVSLSARTKVPDSAKSSALFTAAKAHYKLSHHTPAITFNNAIPITDDDLAVILVRRSDNGYQLLGATNDAELVERAAVVNFKHTFSALPTSVRTIVETLRTQCLPPHILKIQRELVDKSHQKHSDGTKLLSVRRLLYRHDTNDFLLSPVRANAGVVTQAKPKTTVLDNVGKDVFLSSRARLLLERRAISNYDFNLYQAETIEQIPRFSSDNSASHVLRLQNIADQSDFLHLDFWFYTEGETEAVPQVDMDPIGKMDWQHNLPLSWFRHLSLEVVDKWFDSHARHIKRDHQRVCHVQLNRDVLTLHLVRRNGAFEVEQKRPFPTATMSLVSLNLYFLTKDLMPVLKAMADFEISTDIELSATTQALFLRFDTEAAEYSIAIPSTNQQGIRNTGAFTRYAPCIAPSHPAEDNDEPFDYEQEALSLQHDLSSNK